MESLNCQGFAQMRQVVESSHGRCSKLHARLAADLYVLSDFPTLNKYPQYRDIVALGTIPARPAAPYDGHQIPLATKFEDGKRWVF